nr:AraC family transcriptional regulator [Aneurinibacillus sp. XH2]
MNIDVHFPNITSTLQIVGCHFSVKPPGWSFPNHHHYLFELLYCWSGSVTHMINGRKLDLHAGDWLLLQSGVRHQMQNVSGGPYSFFNLHFDIDDPRLRKLLSSSKYRHITRQDSEHSCLPLYMKEMELLLLRSLLPVNGQSAANGTLEAVPDGGRIELTSDNQMALQAYTLLIVREFIRFSSAGAAAAQQSSPSIPNEATQSETDTAHAIEEKLHSMIFASGSISDIAEELHLSRSQCSKIFTRVYGIPPRQYLSRLKLNKAKQLLVNSDMTIEEISSRLGFGSISHFSRQFRRWSGMPPTQFRPKPSISKESGEAEG